MHTFTGQVLVELPAEQVFGYLSEHEHLRGFLPEAIRADVPEGGERIQADPARRSLLWTAEDGHNGGEILVTEQQPGHCTVRIDLHTDERDERDLSTELERSLAVLAQRALAEDDATDAGRARH